jgi:GNAT superfamily N-acetyltransferase
MEIKCIGIPITGRKFFALNGKVEVGWIYFYPLINSHPKCVGYVEDLFVDESFRNRGIGTNLANLVLDAARQANCYKSIATSRHENLRAHSFWERLGYRDYGKEFRLSLV